MELLWPILIIALVFFLFRKKNKKKKSDASPVVISTVKGSAKDFTRLGKPAEPVTEPVVEAADHVIKSIYRYPGKSSIWHCVECECENPIYADKCCVCNRRR